MNKTMILAAMTVAFSFAAPALADASHRPAQGHYIWRSVPQYGPRASSAALQRVWVADHAEMANCNRGRMQMSAHECIGAMHRGHDKPSVG